MKIRCLAVDDEPMALEKLESYIRKIPYLELVAACPCPCEAKNVLADAEVDAIFIDINMPDINGMDFIKGLPDPPLVVFTTAYAEYAAESYKVRAVDYLLKPYSFEDFQRSAEYLKQQYELKDASTPRLSEDEGIFLKVDYRYVRVLLNDIVYIEGMNEYQKFYMVNGDPLIGHISFKQLNRYLPENFLQVHRSYMVNMNHVVEIERSVMLLSNGKHISVSDGYRDAFMEYVGRRTIRK